MEVLDFKQTDSGDLDLSSGDLQITESTAAHKKDLLMTFEGDFTEFPLTGVGLTNYLNASDQGLLLRDITRQMKRDGINVKRVDYQGDEIIIDGNYESN